VGLDSSAGSRRPRAGACPGALGEIAVILDDGNVIYSRPKAGPLADDFLRPARQRARGRRRPAGHPPNLSAGIPVYFH
jgi:hypothetical protein